MELSLIYRALADGQVDVIAGEVSTVQAALAPADIPTAADLDDCEFEVLLYEFKDGLNQYLKASGSPHASLEARAAGTTPPRWCGWRRAGCLSR